ncbi:potassium channel subfamily K member 1-like [Sceloporus undulatus]|uniref:potassium channel subfamily K member 1-like n=1 Tax=Sceloporus undulatus TaxID=8520 RepID=UPI001C4DB205|nr:potassium channel subfamily K member 1-like [Sceloporus undulatus]
MALPPGLRFGLLLASYGLYLLVGAAVFSGLEGPPERALLGSLQRDRLALLEDFQACLSEERLARLVEQVLEAGSYGISGLGNLSGSGTWDFSSAVFFTASVLTTTGKGRWASHLEDAVPGQVSTLCQLPFLAACTNTRFSFWSWIAT